MGTDDVALGEAVGALDVVGDEVPDVVVPDVVGDALVFGVLVLVVPVADVAGDCGVLMSVQDSVRMVLPPALMVSDVAVTV